MLDVSRKPTTTDIAHKARLLHSFAHAAALFAMDANYPNADDQEAMQDHVLLLDELCAELDIMAQVLDGYADYTDFAQLIPEKCEKPKNRAQIMDELYHAFADLAAVSREQNPQQGPTEERQRVNAEIISMLEKLGVIPPEKDGEQG